MAGVKSSFYRKYNIKQDCVVVPKPPNKDGADVVVDGPKRMNPVPPVDVPRREVEVPNKLGVAVDQDFYGPNFTFPTQPTTSTTTQQPITDTTTTQITTAIKDAVASIFNTTLSNGTDQNLNTTFTDSGNGILNGTAIIDEVGMSNNTVVGVTENMNSSVITEIFQNNTISQAMDVNTTFVREATTNTVQTTTEEIIDFMTGSTESLVSTTDRWNISWVIEMPDGVNKNLTSTDDHTYHDQTTYIIMGTLITVLVIIGIVVVYMYVRFKRSHLLTLHGQYRVTKDDAGHSMQGLGQTVDQSYLRC